MATRSPFRRFLPIAVFVALLLGPLVAPATRADDPPAPVSITEGSLEWGFKESFRGYIGGLAGTIAGDGVTLDDEAVATFPVDHGTFDSTTSTTDISFGGWVQYRSHCEDGLGLPEGECALDMTFSQLRIVVSPDEQTLYAHVVGRKLEPGYPMVDFGTIAVSNLGIEGATVATSEGVTSWSEVTQTATAEAVDATTYSAGTPFDVIAFSYTGPGGKPDLGETWTPPGTTALEATHAFKGPVRQNGPDAVFVDDRNGVVHVLDTFTSFDTSMPRIAALSMGGLEPRGTSSTFPASDAGRGPSAFDPASGTVFTFSESRGMIAATWNPVTGDYAIEELPLDDRRTPSGLVWDAATGSLYGTTADADFTALALSRWREDESGWTRVELPLPAPEGDLEQTDYYTPASADGSGLVALSDGSLILTRSFLTGDAGIVELNPRPLRLVPGDGGVSVTELTGATTVQGPDATLGEAGRVAAGPDGRFVLATRGVGWGSSFVRFGRVGDDGAVTFDAERTVIPTPAEEPLLLAFDPDDGTAWIKGFTSGTIVGVGADRTILGTLAAQDTARSYTLGVGADHRIYTGGRTQDVHSQVTEISRLGVSPAVTEQPQDVSIAITDGGSLPVAFSAAATGTPEATVRWQRRAPGASRFVDLVGETEATLQLDVTPADNGAAYRAVFSNVAGELASDLATLTVDTPPVVAVEPADVSVAAGEDAHLQLLPGGSPAPTVTWQQRVNGFWQAVDPDSGDVEVDGGNLVVKAANLAQDGTELRAKLANRVATVYSRVATLTVAPSLAEPVTLRGGHVDWGFAERWRCYVVGTVAHGGIETTGGIARIPGTLAQGGLCAGSANAGSEALRFPVTGGSYDPTTGELSVQLAGTVRFWGHKISDDPPVLDTTFSNLHLEADGDTAALYGDAVGATMGSSVPVTHTDVPIVSVDLPETGPTVEEGRIGWSPAATALTTEGAAIFGSYPVGEAFDPIGLSLSTTPTDPPSPPGDDDDTPAPPSSPIIRVLQPIQHVTQIVQGGTTVQSTETPSVSKGSIAVRRATQRLSSKRRARLATVRCPRSAPASCRVAVRKRVGVKIAGKRYRARILAPRAIEPGHRASIAVRVSKAAARRLAGRRATVKVEVTIKSEGATTTRTIKARITGTRASPQSAR